MKVLYVLVLVFQTAVNDDPAQVRIWYDRHLTTYEKVEECWRMGEFAREIEGRPGYIGYLCVAKKESEWRPQR